MPRCKFLHSSRPHVFPAHVLLACRCLESWCLHCRCGIAAELLINICRYLFVKSNIHNYISLKMFPLGSWGSNPWPPTIDYRILVFSSSITMCTKQEDRTSGQIAHGCWFKVYTCFLWQGIPKTKQISRTKDFSLDIFSLIFMIYQWPFTTKMFYYNTYIVKLEIGHLK